MSDARRAAARRLATRLMTVVIGLRYCGCTGRLKHFQRRLAFLHARGVHAPARR